VNVPQLCLKCQTPLRHGTLRMECPACGAHWPLNQTIPLYGSATYPGDVTQETMHELIALAEQGYWLTAARTMFRDSNPELYDHVADLNRASWIPILPIGPNSTVLDVSSGLGAVTHALALNYHHVVSVEAAADMVRFAKVRLEQEGLKNVDLIQTRLADLPFSTDTFDLIVLNGVLEWVREWPSSGTSREAQIAVLSDLRRLLKPRGVLVIGSENRFGYTSFLRRRGHPRVEGKNRMCSWLDALYRRLGKPGFYRSLADSARGDGPYTHSPNGYADLLRQAGFPVVDLWWPPNGYNSPHTMLRASNRAAIRSYCDSDRRYRDRFHGYALARQLRHWAVVDTNLIHRMFPDVIMIAARSTERGGHLYSSVPLLAVLEQHLAGDRYHADSLATHPYKNKAVLTVRSDNTDTRAVIKVANLRLSGADIVQRGYQNLQRLHSSFAASDPVPAGSIPSPMGVVRVGSLLATMESSARGSRLVDLVLDRRYFDHRDRVRRHLEQITSWLIVSKPALDASGSEGLIDPIPPEWLVAPDRDTGVGPGSAPERFTGTQHGDFNPENIFIDEDSQQLCVIDWDSCATGYPPLFDWFCLVTGLYYTHERVRGLPRGQTVDAISFRQTYFEASWFSEVIRSLSHRLCERLGLDSARLLDYFLLYIVVRYRQLASVWPENTYWGPLSQHLYEQHYQLLLKNQTQCCFWKFSAPGPL
jgi:SAM-dependent methyltransferase